MSQPPRESFLLARTSRRSREWRSIRDAAWWHCSWRRLGAQFSANGTPASSSANEAPDIYHARRALLCFTSGRPRDNGATSDGERVIVVHALSLFR